MSMEWSESSLPPQNRTSVKLVRNTKGYGWELHVYADDLDIDPILAAIKDADAKLREQYPSEAAA